MLYRAAILLLLVVIAYIPACRGDFIWDDDDYVSRNPVLPRNDGLGPIWLQPGATPQYYPLVFTTFWVEYRLWGLDPAGYHWVNVVLHGLNAGLLWLLLRRLGIPWAWLAAAIFALHPVHVESVAWITERKNVLSGFFYLIAFLAYLRFSPLEEIGVRGQGPGASIQTVDESPRPSPRMTQRWLWYALSLLAFLAALFSKTVTCSLPAVLVLVYWWKRAWPTRREWLALAPMFLLGLLLALQTSRMERDFVGAKGEDWDFTPIERCLIAGRALWFYAAKLVWPYPLVFNYERWHIDTGQAWQYLFPLGCLLVGAALALPLLPVSLPGRWRRLGKGPLTACLIFAGTLLPAIGFFNVYPMIYSFVADHFQYLASIALICLAVAVWHSLGARWPWIRALEGKFLAGVLLAVLGYLTWQQGYVYRNLDTLWEDTLRKNPDSWLASYNMGVERAREGNYHIAIECNKRALAIHPHYANAYSNWAHALWMQANAAEEQARLASPETAAELRREAQSKYRLALDKGMKALEYDQKKDPIRYFTLGSIYGRLDEFAKAVPYLEQSIAAARQSSDVPNADLPEYEWSLGFALLKIGRRAESLEHLRRAAELRPDVEKYRLTLQQASEH